jgi:hypothetical protein
VNQTGPLILTAAFSPGFQSRLEGWRRAHYPAPLNLVPAHLSLFRQLPPSAGAEVKARLARLAAGTPPCAAVPGGFALREAGVVLEVRSPALAMLREELAEALHGLLAWPDMAPLRFSVTIQNKVTASVARASLAALVAERLPAEARIERLLLWRYLGGPWELLAEQPLRGRWRG